MLRAERGAAILLPMQGNPAEDWQRLTEHYREISDEELEELAADFVDLTETAQQALRSEMAIRGLSEPSAQAEATKGSDAPSPPRWVSSAQPENGDIHSDASEGEGDSPHEYTWKTQLCECEDTGRAWQLHQVLERAGIESWVEQPGSRYAFGISYPRVMVAADRLEEAIEVARRPIPREIIEESREEMPEFEAPRCPKCGAPDPVLESVEPANAWLCEACGRQWTEPAADAMVESGKTGP